MLFAQNIYYCPVVITLIFLWGATRPHFLESGSMGPFPSPLSFKSRQETLVFPMRRLHQFSDGLRVAQWQPAKELLLELLRKEQFPPHWGCSAGRMSTWRSPPWREKKITKRRAEVASQRAILHHSTRVKLCLEMNWTFQLHQPITSLAPFSLHDFSFWHLQFIYNPNARKNLTPFSDQKNPWK